MMNLVYNLKSLHILEEKRVFDNQFIALATTFTTCLKRFA